MIQTYNNALAPGTYANCAKQAHCYITYAVKYNVPFLSPQTVHVCMYSQYLANKFDSLSSVKNYMSGACSWVVEHGGNPHAFFSCEQSKMLKSLSKDSTHEVKRAFPWSLQHIFMIVNYLDKARNAPLCVKPCILVGFSCYLRASNLLAPTLAVSPGPHTLLRKNILDCGDSLKVIVNSTKTRSKPYVLIIPMLANHSVCPVRAWRSYACYLEPDMFGPAFMINRAAPLNSQLVVNLMRDALSGCSEINTATITMHSLRRGAAQQAEKLGASLEDIKKRGGWASDSGVKPYLSQ